MKIILIIFLIIQSSKVFAMDVGTQTGLELPRYVSLKSNDANLRVGPSKNYPISIKYIIKNYPLKIIEEYTDWRKIEDFNENIGWIHKSLIKGERNAIIIDDNSFIPKIYNTINGKIVGEINNGNIVSLEKCKLKWCKIKFDKKRKGWIKKKYLWGVKDDEIFNIKFFQPLIDYFWISFNLINDFKRQNFKSYSFGNLLNG